MAKFELIQYGVSAVDPMGLIPYAVKCLEHQTIVPFSVSVRFDTQEEFKEKFCQAAENCPGCLFAKLVEKSNWPEGAEL